MFFFGRYFVMLGQTNAVARQIVEQRYAVLFPIDFPGFFPAHDLLWQHVVHHRADQAEQAITAPEPFVEPALHDGNIVLVLLQHELHHFESQGHVARLIGLRGEAESGGRHIAVVGRARDKGHEQQIGQDVFKGKRDRGHELEGPGAHRVLEKALGNGQIPGAVTQVRKTVKAREEFVVVAEGVQLGLGMTQLVDGLHLAGDARTGAAKRTSGMREAAMGGVFQRRDALQPQLHRAQVARVGNIQLAVVLLERIEDGVELALFLGLILPVGLHGEAEWIGPPIPVLDLDAFVFVVGKHLIHGDIGGFPVEAAGQERIAFFQAELFRFCHDHAPRRRCGGCGLRLRSARTTRTHRRPRRYCRREKSN